MPPVRVVGMLTEREAHLRAVGALMKREALEADISREFYLYGGVYIVVDPECDEMRVISQSHFDITVTPKGFVSRPKLPSEVVPHG